jgi:porphobilinogen synthase
MATENIHVINNRRMRVSPHMRELSARINLSHKDFIQPLFVEQGISVAEPIESLRGMYTDNIESALNQIRQDVEKGITKFLLFPVPKLEKKEGFNFSFALEVIETIKWEFGNDIWLSADCCLCSYTPHGHCGVLTNDGSAIHNAKSVEAISDYAFQLAEAGADCIAPSDMMDGRIGAIRTKLNNEGYDDVSIMSYAAKFSSQLYGPFRDICHSAPSGALKNRKTYQLSPLNPDDAIRSVERDSAEGADILMVKPAGWYTDILAKIRPLVKKPIAAYHVSGEYASIELMAEKNWINREAAHTELWASLKRAGADIIISYASRNAEKWIKEMEY